MTGTRVRKFDSTASRVTPVFDEIIKKDRWLSRLLSLVNANVVVHGDGQIITTYYGAKERRLQAPVALLSWLISNLNVAPANRESLAGKRRLALKQKDPATIAEALDLLRSGAQEWAWHVLEGRTVPDVLIETPDALIVIEGKRTEAGPTRDTEWLKGRHQIWRHMDAAWEIRGNRAVYGFFIVEADERGQVPLVWREYMNEARSPFVLASSFSPSLSRRDGRYNGWLLGSDNLARGRARVRH